MPSSHEGSQTAGVRALAPSHWSDYEFEPRVVELPLPARYVGLGGFRHSLLAQALLEVLAHQIPSGVWQLGQASFSFAPVARAGSATLETNLRSLPNAALHASVQPRGERYAALSMAAVYHQHWPVSAVPRLEAPWLGRPDQHRRLSGEPPEWAERQCRDATPWLGTSGRRSGGFVRFEPWRPLIASDVPLLFEPWLAMPTPLGQRRELTQLHLDYHQPLPAPELDPSRYLRVLIEPEHVFGAVELLRARLWSDDGALLVSASLRSVTQP